MSVLPIIIDSQPEYLAGSAQTLLQLPVGTGTVLTWLREKLRLDVESTVLTSAPVDSSYERALREDLPELRGIYPMQRLGALLTEFEPADWLLFVDAARFPIDGAQLNQLSQAASRTRTVTFGVARQTEAETARERVMLDQAGNVQRIQRLYPSVTRMSGKVSFALIPAAVAYNACDEPVSSLGELRRMIAEHAIPSQDVELNAAAVNLSEEKGFLQFNEWVLHGLAVGAAPETYTNLAPGILIGPNCRLDPTARVFGPVLLQRDVSLGPGSVVIGPATLGAGTDVKGCVAQCVLGPNTKVAAGTTLRQRITSGVYRCTDEAASAPDQTSREPFAAGSTPKPAPLAPGESTIRRWYPPVKCLVESLLAAMGLAVLSVPLLVTALLVKLTSKGPALFGHVREGKEGCEFHCWKFRTMIQNAHALQRALYKQNKVDGPQFKLDRDPRITPVGRVLRSTNIDELPQLINVVLGQMSLIGPRPSPFRENQICVPWRRARLSVRPGITGLWQICRNNRAAGDFHQWIYFDMLYVKHMSPMLDLKIMLATLFTFAGRFSVPLHWMIARHKLEELGFSERPRRAPILEDPLLVGEPMRVGAETQ